VCPIVHQVCIVFLRSLDGDSSNVYSQDQEMIIGKKIHGGIVKALTVGSHHTKRHGQYDMNNVKIYCNLFFNSSKLYFKKTDVSHTSERMIKRENVQH
jgi:hypothetical protein